MGAPLLTLAQIQILGKRLTDCGSQGPTPQSEALAGQSSPLQGLCDRDTTLLMGPTSDSQPVVAVSPLAGKPTSAGCGQSGCAAPVREASAEGTGGGPTAEEAKGGVQDAEWTALPGSGALGVFEDADPDTVVHYVRTHFVCARPSCTMQPSCTLGGG